MEAARIPVENAAPFWNYDRASYVEGNRRGAPGRRVALASALVAPARPMSNANGPTERRRRATRPGRARRGPNAAARPEFVILSRTKAARYQPSGVEVCISISNSEAPDLVLSPQFHDVLRLRFDDISEDARGMEEFFVSFRQEHAHEIIAFVQRWRSAERIVVHCLAGLSRSPAVAIGLCEIFGWPLEDLENTHPLWNKWVRAELVRVGRDFPQL
jgi:predicted protein tyrosine phosphatase